MPGPDSFSTLCRVGGGPDAVVASSVCPACAPPPSRGPSGRCRPATQPTAAQVSLASSSSAGIAAEACGRAPLRRRARRVAAAVPAPTCPQYGVASCGGAPCGGAER
ncbi:hypothetical protein BS78_04G176800 [Paspalum vaginatum]|nr:hypothetical protein BS78_04G176800 [Paspalum vaginatum]